MLLKRHVRQCNPHLLGLECLIRQGICPRLLDGLNLEEDLFKIDSPCASIQDFENGLIELYLTFLVIFLKNLS